jgi:hypothetical protein
LDSHIKGKTRIESIQEQGADLRGRKWQEAGKDCIMRNFINYRLHKIQLGFSNPGR